MRFLRAVVCFALCLLAVSFADAASYTASPAPSGLKFRNDNGDLLLSSQVREVRSETDWDLNTTLQIIDRHGTTVAQHVSPDKSSYTAEGFNDLGAIAGTHTTFIQFKIPNGPIAQFVVDEHAFAIVGGAFVDIHAALEAALGSESSHVDRSYALDINDSGDIAGRFWKDDRLKGFVYRNGVVTDLGALGDGSIVAATAINNAGQATGHGTRVREYAFLYSQGVVTDLGHLDSRSPDSEGIDINDAGHVTGSSVAYNGPFFAPRAFLYRNNAMLNLGTLGGATSVPSAINNFDVVVGYAATPDGTYHGFVFKSRRMLNLNEVVDTSITGHISGALSVNDDGVIVASAANGTFFLTPIPNPPTDHSIYNFETFTQNWLSSGEPIVTVGTSMAQKFLGESSLSIQVNDAGFASISVSAPTVRPGQTITFHVYLPADAQLEWIQPFALEGEAGHWAWHGNWMPIENLELGAWNTITVDVPADATAIKSIGLELFVAEPFAGTVYLDSINYAFPTDDAQFNFETDAQGWTSQGDSSSTSESTGQPFAGSGSLAIKFNNSTETSVRAAIVPGLGARRVTFNVFVPLDAPVSWLKPYVQEGAAGGWGWYGGFSAAPLVRLGAWNTMTVDVPQDAQDLEFIGLDIAMREFYEGTLFVDGVKLSE